MKKKIMSLVLAAAMIMSFGLVMPAAATAADKGAPIDPLYDLDYIQSLPETNYEGTPVEEPMTLTGRMGDISTYASKPSWVKMLHGTYSESKVYSDPSEGAYYYAVSPGTTKSEYSAVFVNVELPEVDLKDKRTAFISLGINNGGSFNVSGSLFFVDVGLKRTGDSWYPNYYGPYVGGEDYTTFKINDKDVTNVIMMLSILNSTQAELYIQPCIGTTATGAYFKQSIPISTNASLWNLTSGKICYYRFASLVPSSSSIPNNMFDQTSMRGGAFTNCQLLHVPTNQYKAWGIDADTDLIETAWMVNPEHITVYKSTYYDAFNIFYSNS